MQYRALGATGLKISEISLGTWITVGEQLQAVAAAAIIRRAFELGVNFFDSADIYAKGGAESLLGEAVKGLPREALVLSSKVFCQTMPGPNGKGLSRKHIFESCHASLKRMGTEYLDLYFCHAYDPETPVEEVVWAMDDLVRQGKVLYWGTSNWRAWQIGSAIALARRWQLAVPRVEQPEYNMLVRRVVEDELIPAARDLGFGLVSYGPLRSGLLSGKYANAIPEGTRLGYREWLRPILTDLSSIAKVKELRKIADEMGVTTAQLAIAWLLRLPELTSVITGASTIGQLEENLKAGEITKALTPEILKGIESVLQAAPAGQG